MICLTGDDINDASLAHLAKTFPELRELGLCGCNGISADGIKVLVEGCKNLIYIGLQNCGWLNDLALKNLTAENSKLERLDLSSCFSITAAGFACLKSCKKLKTLFSAWVF